MSEFLLISKILNSREVNVGIFVHFAFSGGSLTCWHAHLFANHCFVTHSFSHIVNAWASLCYDSFYLFELVWLALILYQDVYCLWWLFFVLSILALWISFFSKNATNISNILKYFKSILSQGSQVLQVRWSVSEWFQAISKLCNEASVKARRGTKQRGIETADTLRG